MFHHLLISSMSASHSVQLSEIELSLSPVLDYGTVCRQILSHVTLCHSSICLHSFIKMFQSRQSYPSIVVCFFRTGYGTVKT